MASRASRSRTHPHPARRLAAAATGSLPVASLLALLMAVVVDTGFLGTRPASLGDLGRLAGTLEGFAIWFLWLYPVLTGTWFWSGSEPDHRQFAQL